MDKALPPSDNHSKPSKTFIRLSQCNLPGSEGTFKGHTALRTTIDVDELARRICKGRSEYRPETIANIYRMMTNEIYQAVSEGYNVDFDLARLDISVNGRFAGLHDRFDPERHHCLPAFYPSPRLRQLAADIPGEVSELGAGTEPWLIRVSAKSAMQMQQAGLSYPDPLPAGFDDPLWISGRRLKVMGDLPGVGITLTSEETGETYAVPANKLYVNTPEELCFAPPVPLTAGGWSITVGTQYNYRYRLYKQVRCGSIRISLVDVAPL